MSFSYTAEHVLEALARFRAQQWWRPYYVWAVRIYAALMFCIAGLSLLAGIYVPAVLPLLPLIIILPAQRISDYVTRIRLRRSPELDAEYKFEISEDGISAKSVNVESAVKWSGYSRAVFFEHGVLVFQGANVVTWLRDDAFENADQATQFRQTVSAKLPTSEFIS